MENNKIEATVILAKCQKSGEIYGNRVEKKKDGKWHFTWSFKVNENVADREGYKEDKIFGDIVLDETYKGCPYCHSFGWIHCNHCDMLTCREGTGKRMKCQWCGNEGEVGPLPPEFQLRGGGM